MILTPQSKRGKTRDGQIAEKIHYTGSAYFPYEGRVNNKPCTWTETGKYTLTKNFEHALDLVELLD